MRLRSQRNHGDGIPIRTKESPMKVDLKSLDEPKDEAFFSEESGIDYCDSLTICSLLMINLCFQMPL